MDAQKLQNGPLDVIVGGHTIRLSEQTYEDGTAFLSIEGVGCRLEGEMPGEYVPMVPGSAAWWATRSEDAYNGLEFLMPTLHQRAFSITPWEG